MKYTIHAGIILLLNALALPLAAHAAGGIECHSERCFRQNLSYCDEASWKSNRAFGGRAQYRILDRAAGGGCRVEMRYTENPNRKWVGKPLRFILPGHRHTEQDLKSAVSTCLNGESGAYHCSGPLFRLAGGHPPAPKAMASPCGKKVASQGEPLFPMRRNGKWGYVNRRGEWVIPPRWQHAEVFSEGRAVVDAGMPQQRRGAWGVIDRSGHYVVKPQLLSVSQGQSPIKPFSQGCAPVEDLNGSYFIDRDGHTWLKARLPQGWGGEHPNAFGRFSGGMAWFLVHVNGKPRYGWIDTKGTVVISPKFTHVGDFHEGLAATATDTFGDHWGYIDTHGKLVMPGKRTLRWAGPFHEGVAAARTRNDHTPYIDKSGNIAIESIHFDRPHLWQARQGSKTLRKRSASGFVASGRDFSDGLAPVEAGLERNKITAMATFTEKVYIDHKGRVVLEPADNPRIGRICHGLLSFHHGLALIRVASPQEGCRRFNYGYIDKRGHIVVGEGALGDGAPTAEETRPATATASRDANDTPAAPDRHPAGDERTHNDGDASNSGVGKWAADSAHDEAKRQESRVGQRARDELHKAAGDMVDHVMHGLFGN